MGMSLTSKYLPVYTVISRVLGLKRTMKAWVLVVVFNLLLYILFPLANFFLMFALNLGYLFYQYKAPSTYGLGFVTAIVAGFKILWNTVGMPFAIKLIRQWFSKELRSDQSYDVSSFILQTGIVVANSFLVPIIANMIFNPGCFSFLFFPPDALTIFVQYPLCTFVSLDGMCEGKQEQVSQIFFQPTFVYGYQCASALLRVYAPIYIATYIFVTFVSPVFRLWLAYACRKMHHRDKKEGESGGREEEDKKGWPWLRRLVRALDYVPRIFFAPLIFFPPDKALARIHSESRGIDGIKKGNFSLFNTSNVAAQMVNHLVMLSTYGISFPPLGMLITLGICNESWSWQAVMGWYFLDLEGDSSSVEVTRDSVQFDIVRRVASTVDADGRHIRVDFNNAILAVLEKNCEGLWRVFDLCGWYLLIGMALFHSYFLYDMLEGDEPQAKPVIYALLLVPLLLWLMVRTFPKLSKRMYECVKPIRKSKILEDGIELIRRQVSVDADAEALRINGGLPQQFDMGFQEREFRESEDVDGNRAASIASVATTTDDFQRIALANMLSSISVTEDGQAVQSENPLVRAGDK